MALRSQDEDKLEPDAKEFLAAYGRNVRDARKRAGLSQRRLAEAAGLTQQYIFFIENHGSNVSTTKMVAIANACEVSLYTLMPETKFSSSTPVSIVNLMCELCEALSHLKNLDTAEVLIVNYPGLLRQLKELASAADKQSDN